LATAAPRRRASPPDPSKMRQPIGRLSRAESDCPLLQDSRTHLPMFETGWLETLLNLPRGWLWLMLGLCAAVVIIALLIVYVVLLKGRMLVTAARRERRRQALDALLNNLGVSVVVQSPRTGEVLCANRQALQSHGVGSFEELRARGWWAQPPYSFADMLDWLQRAAREGPQRLEWRALRADGEPFWEEVILQPMHLHGQEVVVVAATDITAHKTTERVQRNFINGMAHELRTPLAVIETALANLRNRTIEFDSTLQPRFDRIAAALKRLNLVAAKALAVDSANRRRIRLEPRQCRPSELVGEVLAMFDHDPASHQLEISLPEDDRAMTVDSNWLAIAVLNLLDNAAKYSPRGSAIAVVIERMDTCLKISVSDRGPGIPEPERRRVFARFYRGVSAEAAPGGMGIGLYLVDLIARLHCGRAWAEARAGGGSRFVLEVESLEADR